MSEGTQNDTQEVLQWYRDNSDSPPFNPDGMCLKICRIARNIASRYPSAFSAALNTPEKYRVYKVSDIRRGHDIFFDDKNDDNPFGHITTCIGRVPNADPNSLHDLLVKTNSVVAGKIVVVRADYFLPHWGDPFEFAASYLNGEPFYDMQPKAKPQPPHLRKKVSIRHSLESIKKGIPEMKEVIAANSKKPRTQRALKRDLNKMIEVRDNLEAILKRNKEKK
jgi:hypothetical protein